MTQSSRTFRIFISSTFSDFKDERNALQREVFPKLRELCMQHGCRFQAIDLRWGVSDEAALDQQTVKICLEEIDRCQKVTPRPNFIVLLGDRYGWRPLPYEIPAVEFEEIDKRISTDEDRKLLHQWYQRDNNAVPPVYCLLPRTGASVDLSVWEVTEQRLHSILICAISEMNITDDQRLKYIASATEQEIDHGALQFPDAKEHVYCFFRTIKSLPQNASAKDYLDIDDKGNPDQESHAFLGNLKERLIKLLPQNTYTYGTGWAENIVDTSHIDKLCKDVYESFSRIILEEIAQLEEIDPLEKEIIDHEIFRKERSKFFIGRISTLQDIADYLKGNDPNPLAIVGVSGSGKSALIARAVQEALRNHADNDIIHRFIGATPGSSEGRSLLESLCRQVSRTYGADEGTIPSDYKELVQEFPKRLALATGKKPLILFLDALDQLSDTDHARNLSWLPTELPPAVRVIVSTLPGECYAVLERRLPQVNRIKLEPMPMHEGSELLNLWLKDSGRTLQSQQMKEITEKFVTCGLPLYLKLAFEEARKWKSYSETTTLSSDISGIIRDLFKRLSADSDHGEMIVSRSLGYLAAAKNGLTEDELIDVLSRDKEVIEDFLKRSPKSPAIQQLPVVVWSRLYFDLEPYLAERTADGTSLMNFYHRQFAEVVKEELLTGKRTKQRHEGLAQYFSSLPLWMERNDKKVVNVRKVSEQPWQQAHAEMEQAYKETLTDFEFMFAKNLSVGLFELIQDYNLIIPKSKTLSMIHQALLISGYALSKEPHQMPGQLMGRLQGSHDPDIQTMLDKMDAWRGFAWLLPVTQSLTTVGGGPLAAILKGHTYSVVSLAASRDKPLLATASHDNSIIIWNLDTGEKVNTIFQPKAIDTVALTPNGQWVISAAEYGDFGIKIWNVETGDWVKTLEGHKDKINALTVTPDGRHLLSASSDKTARIFNFEDWQLLHILQGHTHSVTCIAVTPDGNRIITGSKDFTIKIWDRQSGRLLKTLEGHRSTVNHLAVTSDGRRLISACGHVFLKHITHDGQRIVYESRDYCLKVWDLESGLVLHTLEGHSAPVKGVAIYPDGKRAVSASYDGTIRLWDLIQGRQLYSVKAHEGGVAKVIIAADERVITIAGAKNATLSEEEGRPKHEFPDYSIKIWDLGMIRPYAAMEFHTNQVSKVALAAENSIAVSASHDGNLKVWNTQNGKLIHTLNDHKEPVFSAAITPDGRLVASAGCDFTIKLWDLNQINKPENIFDTFQRWLFKKLKGIKTLKLSKQAINLDITPDGRWIIFANAFGSLSTWYVRRKKHEPIHDLYQSVHLIVSENAKNILALDLTRQILAEYAIIDRQQLKTTKIQSNVHISAGLVELNWAALSKTGKRCVACAGPSIVVLDTEHGRELKRWQAHPDFVVSVAINSEGTRAVSASLMDDTVKVWDLQNSTLIAGFAVEGHIQCSAIDDTGSIIMIGEHSGKVHIFHLKGRV